MSALLCSVEKGAFPDDPITTAFDLALSDDLMDCMQQLMSVAPANMVVNLWPGLNKTKDSPVTIRDAISEAIRSWAVPVGATAVMEAASDLAGLPYLKTAQNTAGPAEGLRSQLLAAPTDYTVLVPFKLNSLTPTNCLYSLGNSGGSRITLYVSAGGGAIYHNHGASDAYYYTTSFVINTWYAAMITYKADTNLANIYLGNNTSRANRTMTQDASGFTPLVGLGATGYDNQVSNGKFPFLLQWDKVLSGDEIATEMEACNRLFTL